MIIIGILIVLGFAGIIYVLSVPGYVADSMSPVDSDFEYPLESEYKDMDFESNGERIYYTGINESGSSIAFEGGPHWFYSGSCANCHGTNGKGGVPIMEGNVAPPDIRYAILSSGEEHMNHVPYTEETLKEAIREGIDSEGLPLDLTMPRWEMSEVDIDNLIDYLKTL